MKRISLLILLPFCLLLISSCKKDDDTGTPDPPKDPNQLPYYMVNGIDYYTSQVNWFERYEMFYNSDNQLDSLGNQTTGLKYIYNLSGMPLKLRVYNKLNSSFDYEIYYTYGADPEKWIARASTEVTSSYDIENCDNVQYNTLGQRSSFNYYAVRNGGADSTYKGVRTFTYDADGNVITCDNTYYTYNHTYDYWDGPRTFWVKWTYGSTAPKNESAAMFEKAFSMGYFRAAGGNYGQSFGNKFPDKYYVNNYQVRYDQTYTSTDYGRLSQFVNQLYANTGGTTSYYIRFGHHQ